MEINSKTAPKNNRFAFWLMHGATAEATPSRPAHEKPQEHWYKIICLTGVDYFSTLGYQPGIAFLAAGALSPFATLILVGLTVFGALPVYFRVAVESPHGQGSISMLERLLSRWSAKLFVLVLLGFIATDFVITITLSAADAAAHFLENPFVVEHLAGANHPVIVTLLIIALLGAVFLKGFKEAINIAVFLVVAYLLLNVIVIAVGIYEIVVHPTLLGDWQQAIFRTPQTGSERSWLAILLFSFIVFPKLALGLSGFETGVAVMPLIKKPDRIAGTRKLLAAAALIMSVMLISSSFVTTVIIPEAEFAEGGKANGRALAYVAHEYLGEVFGTGYDISTIFILWFAGASAMAGLINIVPQYLPRYGMAPEWARATRPLVLMFVAICFVVTLIFQASVDAQGGAYATGVLVLMTSASIAVTISAWKRRQIIRFAYLSVSAVFAFTTAVNIVERPDGIKIASVFILFIIIASFLSRILRSTEVRIDRIEFDQRALEILNDSSGGEIRIVTNRRDAGDIEEYRFKEKEKRTDTHIPLRDRIIFFEIDIGDASEFRGKLRVRGEDIGPFRVLRTTAPAVPNAIAALLLDIRDKTGKNPHVYFGWSEGNPLRYLIRYILFGEGDTAPVTHEILRQAEPDIRKRPYVHVGG